MSCFVGSTTRIGSPRGRFVLVVATGTTTARRSRERVCVGAVRFIPRRDQRLLVKRSIREREYVHKGRVRGVWPRIIDMKKSPELDMFTIQRAFLQLDNVLDSLEIFLDTFVVVYDVEIAAVLLDGYRATKTLQDLSSHGQAHALVLLHAIT